MYLLNRGYTTKIDDNLSVNGYVISAAGAIMPAYERRTLPNADIRLFDPFYYFPFSLNKSCSATFQKLSSYPWFNPSVAEYNSDIITLSKFKSKMSPLDAFLPIDDNDINNRLMKCIQYQVNLKVSHIIIPVPLINDAEDEFSLQLKYINYGLDIAKKYPLPVLISVPISDTVIINKKYENNELIATILDNLTALDDADGFYITIARSSNSKTIIEKSIVQTVLEFSYILGHQLSKEVFLNYVDVLGLLGIAVGAKHFASGYTNKEKRLYFNDYIDGTQGRAYPHFYSNTLIGDLFSDRDLSKLKGHNLLDMIKDDSTTFSSSLYDSLKNNLPIALNPDWAERISNTTKAKLHRSEKLTLQCNNLLSLNFKDRIKSTQNWLQKADIYTTYITEQLKCDPLTESFNHVSVWKNCFDEFIKKYNLI